MGWGLLYPPASWRWVLHPPTALWPWHHRQGALGHIPHWPRWSRGRFVNWACWKLAGWLDRENKPHPSPCKNHTRACTGRQEGLWDGVHHSSRSNTWIQASFLLDQHLSHEFGFWCHRQLYPLVLFHLVETFKAMHITLAISATHLWWYVCNILFFNWTYWGDMVNKIIQVSRVQLNNTSLYTVSCAHCPRGSNALFCLSSPPAPFPSGLLFFA